MALNFTSLLQIVNPKKSNRKGGTSRTSTYSPSNAGGLITLPTFRDHLVDVFASRQSDDARTLMKTLFTHDTDVSATVHGYLTLANTDMNFLVRDIKGEIDRDATKELQNAFKRITTPTDYTLGFTLKRSMDMHCELMRHMGLLARRGRCRTRSRRQAPAGRNPARRCC